MNGNAFQDFERIRKGRSKKARVDRTRTREAKAAALRRKRRRAKAARKRGDR